MSITHRVRFAWSLESVLAGCRCCMLAFAAAMAPDGPVRAATSNDAECRMTSLARKALDNDAQLGALNLGVSVRDQVAAVWGAVPSPAIADRAVNCLGRVPGIARVENQLTVESPDDPLVDFLKLPARPLSPKPIPGMRVLNQVEMEPKSTQTSHGPVPVWQPASVPVFTPTPAAAREPKLTSRSPDVAVGTPATMPPIPLPVMRPLPVPVDDRTMPVKAETEDLNSAIARMKQDNDRLRGIQPDVRGGAVYLRGTIRDWEELHAFARQIARLPGVERVVLDGVRARGR